MLQYYKNKLKQALKTVYKRYRMRLKCTKLSKIYENIKIKIPLKSFQAKLSY